VAGRRGLGLRRRRWDDQRRRTFTSSISASGSRAVPALVLGGESLRQSTGSGRGGPGMASSRLAAVAELVLGLELGLLSPARSIPAAPRPRRRSLAGQVIPSEQHGLRRVAAPLGSDLNHAETARWRGGRHPAMPARPRGPRRASARRRRMASRRSDARSIPRSTVTTRSAQTISCCAGRFPLACPARRGRAPPAVRRRHAHRRRAPRLRRASVASVTGNRFTSVTVGSVPPWP
jgi:hypothetical protein